MCLLEAQAGLMNCFCPMELHPEFGLDHPPAVCSTLELVEFSIMSWLSCHCPSPAPQILSNLPLATTTSCGHEGLSSVAHMWGPQALEMWDTQHIQLGNMIQDFWESQASGGSSDITGPPCTEPSHAPGTSTQQTEGTDQLQWLPSMRMWAEQAILVPGEVLLCCEQGSTTIPSLAATPVPATQQPTPLSPPG